MQQWHLLWLMWFAVLCGTLYGTNYLLLSHIFRDTQIADPRAADIKIRVQQAIEAPWDDDVANSSGGWLRRCRSRSRGAFDFAQAPMPAQCRPTQDQL